MELGRFNTMEVVKEVDFGLYLDGGDHGEILLPSRYVPENTQVGDWLEVFIYLDIDERLVATTLTPLVQVGEFGYLKVAWVNQYGAFLDWGLMKDLFVPFREQKMKMEQGKGYVVYVYIDEESFRIVGSAKVDRYLSKETAPYSPGQEVEVLVWQKTDLGLKVIVENRYPGMIFNNELFGNIRTGMKLKAFVKQVREDGKLDIALQKEGFKKVDDFSETLFQYLKENGGSTSLGDKSPAEDIYETFGVSKKTFKKAVGDLYKKRMIVFTPDGGISLPEKGK